MPPVSRAGTVPRRRRHVAMSQHEVHACATTRARAHTAVHTQAPAKGRAFGSHSIWDAPTLAFSPPWPARVHAPAKRPRLSLALPSRLHRAVATSTPRCRGHTTCTHTPEHHPAMPSTRVNAHKPASLALRPCPASPPCSAADLDVPPPLTLAAVLAHPDPARDEALALLVAALNPRPHLDPAAVLCCLAISAHARHRHDDRHRHR